MIYSKNNEKWRKSYNEENHYVRTPDKKRYPTARVDYFRMDNKGVAVFSITLNTSLDLHQQAFKREVREALRTMSKRKSRTFIQFRKAREKPYNITNIEHYYFSDDFPPDSLAFKMIDKIKEAYA